MDQEIFIKWELIEHDDNRKHYHRFIVRVPKLKDLSPHAINSYFGIQIKELELFEINGFLDFHFSHYKGGKENFFMFIEHSLINLDLLLKAKIEENKSKNVDDEFQRSRLQEYDRFIEIQKICKDWIEKKKKELAPESKNGGSILEDEITLKRQLLILHYLGFIEKNLGLSQNKLAEFLSTFLGKNLQNIRNALSGGKLGECKTEENLDYVYDLFKRYKFDTMEIQKDLLKIHKSE